MNSLGLTGRCIVAGLAYFLSQHITSQLLSPDISRLPNLVLENDFCSSLLTARDRVFDFIDSLRDVPLLQRLFVVFDKLLDLWVLL